MFFERVVKQGQPEIHPTLSPIITTVSVSTRLMKYKCEMAKDD